MPPVRPVTLKDGRQTNIYLDMKSVLSNGRRMGQAAQAMAEYAKSLGLDYNAVGGPTMGADVVSHGMLAHNPDLEWFSVRGKPKTYGTTNPGGWIEGAHLGPQHRVILTDDVADTGKSLVDAYNRVRETGANVTAVMPIADRRNKTRTQFEQLGVPYYPLMSYNDLGIDTLSPQAPHPPQSTRSGRTAMADYDEYHGAHQAPGPRSGWPIWDMTGEHGNQSDVGGVPEDWYTHPHYYSGGEVSPREVKRVQQLYNQIRMKPEQPVEIYRALPQGNTRFNTGDWVTPSLAYAHMHTRHPTDPTQGWPVIKITVPAKHLYQNGDSYYRWGTTDTLSPVR